MDEELTVTINAKTESFEAAMRGMEASAKNFGSVMTTAVKGAILEGKSFEDVLRQIGLSLTSKALSAGLKPLENLMSGAFQGVFSSIMPFAKGGVTPFANGGIVGGPTLFPMSGQMGLMGEAGPEAIMPLRRGADGRLGVAGAGGGGSTVVNVSVQAQDAASFRRSESQISAMMARAVARGQKGI